MHELAPLFAPRGIVVVGASSSPEKLGAVMAQSLSNYPAQVELVNSRGENGMHTSIAEAAAAIVDGPDLAVLCVPAAATAQALRDSAANGVKAALVCAGGFAEAGGPGIEFAHQVEAAVRETGIRLLGPEHVRLLRAPPQPARQLCTRRRRIGTGFGGCGGSQRWSQPRLGLPSATRRSGRQPRRRYRCGHRYHRTRCSGLSNLR